MIGNKIEKMNFEIFEFKSCFSFFKKWNVKLFSEFEFVEGGYIYEYVMNVIKFKIFLNIYV